MIRAYYRAKLFLVIALTLVIVGCIARIELERALYFEPASATVVRTEVTCVQRGGRTHGPCKTAPPGADTRTAITLVYRAPDQAERTATVTCDTAREETIVYAAGQQVEILVDERDQGNIQKSKCRLEKNG